MRRERAGAHRQIFRHEIDKHGGEDQDEAKPETPIAVGEFPVRAVGRRAALPSGLMLVRMVPYLDAWVIESSFPSRGFAPLPVPDFRQVLAMLVDVLLMLDELVLHQLL